MYALNAQLVSAARDAAGLGEAAIEVRALPNGPRVGIGPVLDPAISPASMIKVPIAAALRERWRSGAAQPRGRVEVSEANLTANDAPSPLRPGYVATLEELGRLMLTRSDNVATNVLIDVLERDWINACCVQWGLAATAVRRKLSGSLPLIEDAAATGFNAHPAKDAADLFERIALEPEGWLMRTLAAQEWNDKLSAGLRPGDRFAHKTGETSDVSHDGGILEMPEGRFVIVVYTTLPAAGSGARFARFMHELRPHLRTRGSAARSV